MSRKRNKTILYLRTDLNKELTGGGSVSHTLGVIDGFLEKEYKIFCASSAMVDILKNKKNLNFLKLSNPQIFWFLRWKFWPLRERLHTIFSNLFFAIKILYFWGYKKIDFIYQRNSFLNFVGVILKKVKGVKLVLEYNGSEVKVIELWNQSQNFRLKLAEKIENYCLKNSDYVSVVSDVLKDELLEKGIAESKIIVNPNGVNTRAFDPNNLKEERETIRKKLGVEYKFIFGFVGTFSYWHGIEVIKYLIPKVLKKHKNVHFLLIGDGPLKKDLEGFVNKGNFSNGVTFTGLVKHGFAVKYLSACDAFLCPTQPNSDGSRFFGSPTKLFEYMSLAKPTIVSNFEQLAKVVSPAVVANQLKLDEKIVINDEVGIKVDPDDFDGFVMACCWLAELGSGDEGLKKLGFNARKKVLENYTWSKNVEKLLQSLYKNAC